MQSLKNPIIPISGASAPVFGMEGALWKLKEDYYIILDEVQYLDEFEDVLNSLLHIRNADVYVTGSNSKFLSSDVITQFRGRGDEIRVYPLSFSEYVSVYQGSQDEAWDDYLVYGGLPLILTMEEAEDKAEYLNSLFQKVYISDIVERHNVRNKAELDELVDVLASAIGSYTNQTTLLRISDFFRKIVVVGDNIKVRRDENGIITIGLRNFLLDENSLKL